MTGPAKTIAPRADRAPASPASADATPLRARVENLPFVIVRLDREGTLRYAGPGAEALTGYDAEALAAPHMVLRLVHPEDRHRLTAGLRQVDADGRAVVRFRLVRVDGSVRMAEARIAAAEDGFEGVVLDLTDAALDASELLPQALYQIFLEQSPVGVVHLDAEGVVTFESHRARRITGEAPADTWIGRRMADLEGFDADLLQPLQRMQATGDLFDVRNVAYTRADGIRVHLRVVGSPIRDPEAGQVGGVLMLLDVTAERERTEALRLRARYEAAELTLRNAALSSPDGLAFLEATVALLGRTAGADRVRVLLGDESETLISVTLWTADVASIPEPLEVDLSAWPTLAAGQPLRAERGGTSQALLDAAACEAAVLVPFQDEGERIGLFLLERLDGGAAWQVAEVRALQRLIGLFETLWAWTGAEARYRQTVADLSDGLFSFAHDLNGNRRYAFVTPQFEHLTGCAAANLVEEAENAEGIEWAGLIHEEDRDAFSAHEAALQAGDPSRLSYRIRRPDDGAVRWIRESATPSRSPSGRPIVGGLVSDVTEQKRAEETLRQAKHAAEQASQAKTSFMAMMSHEIRSPLGAIRGFAELLKGEVDELGAEALPPQIGEFTGIIAENTRRALHLVHNLFDLARLETGALTLQHTAVALHPAIEGVLAEYQAGAEAKGVRVAFDPATAEPLVAGDPDRVTQVVDHLVSNAVKFTEAGQITLRTRVDDEAVRLIVEDTGVGIAETYLDGLFAPFSQEDYRLNRAYEGSGLGLAIVRRLLDAMGGTIQVESEKEKGSRFVVTLKRMRETEKG
ncbi:MAG: PAS domain S-box protein [Rhodothermaceae bacterium]|nr:PAS domain S-box protein [Rhodothermaceae bacterium]